MGRYEREDRFYRMAKGEGRASRAAYKIEQIQKRFRIIRNGDHIVDLGCAPGGWLEIASRWVGKDGCVLGIDTQPIKAGGLPNVIYVNADANKEDIIGIIKDRLGEADVVLSDMAPKTSGVKFKDSHLSSKLALRALDIARQVLRHGGNFVVKIFPGEGFAAYKKELGGCFEMVAQYRPEATRKTSIEVYLIARGYRGC